MLNCEQVTRRASDFLERRLRWRARLEMLIHLAMCKGCKRYVEQLRLTLEGLRALPRPAGAPADERLLEEFRRRTREDSRGSGGDGL